jgi:hypothetical protein
MIDAKESNAKQPKRQGFDMDIVKTLLLAVIGSTIAHSGSASTRNRSGPAAAAMKTLTNECSANQRAPLFGALVCAIAEVVI